MDKETTWFSVITRVLVVVLLLGTFRQAKINSQLEIEISQLGIETAQLKVDILENNVAALKRYNVQAECMELATNVIKGLTKFHMEEEEI